MKQTGSVADGPRPRRGGWRALLDPRGLRGGAALGAATVVLVVLGLVAGLAHVRGTADLSARVGMDLKTCAAGRAFSLQRVLADCSGDCSLAIAAVLAPCGCDWLVTAADGELLAASPSLAQAGDLVGELRRQASVELGVRGYARYPAQGRPWVVAVAPVAPGLVSGGWRVWLVADGREPSRVADAWARDIVLLALVLAGVAYVVAASLAGRLVRPVVALTETVAAIARTGKLHSQVQPARITEITALVRNTEAMLATLAQKTADLVRRERTAKENHRATTQLIVSGLAHQLNNPLSGMLDCVEELQRGDLDGATTRETIDLLAYGLDRIHRISQRLNSLDLVPGDTGRITEVEPAVQAVVGLCHAALQRKSITVEVTADAWIVATADPSVVSDIVDNLLSNAIEACGPGGRVHIHVSQRSRAQIAIDVEDDGVGMTPDVVARMFDPFYSRRENGVGLGLWTVQAYLGALGGAIDVDSSPGTGTTVRVVLPAARAWEPP